jgi:hypothetical protein
MSRPTPRRAGPPSATPPSATPPSAAPHGPARRVFLAAGLGVAAAAAGSALGLNRTLHHKVAVPPPAPPAELVALLSIHVQLQADCDAIVAADPAETSKLGPLRSDLAAHQAALRAVLENYPGWRYEQAPQGSPSSGAASASGSSPGPASPAPTVASLTVALRAQASQLSTACANWPPDNSSSPQTAAGSASAVEVVGLLGSMAACLNVHLAMAL